MYSVYLSTRLGSTLKLNTHQNIYSHTYGYSLLNQFQPYGIINMAALTLSFGYLGQNIHPSPVGGRINAERLSRTNKFWQMSRVDPYELEKS